MPYLVANGVRLARVAFMANTTPAAPLTTSLENGNTAVTSGQIHVFFELGDHLGSTSSVLDKATGEVVNRSTFQAYGGTESSYRPATYEGFREAYGFTGKESDVEVGLIYFGKRFYNPALQRWVSADPLEIHGPGAADANLYAYVSGGALRNIDPLGLQEQENVPAPATRTGNPPTPPPPANSTCENGGCVLASEPAANSTDDNPIPTPAHCTSSDCQPRPTQTFYEPDERPISVIKLARNQAAESAHVGITLLSGNPQFADMVSDSIASPEPLNDAEFNATVLYKTLGTVFGMVKLPRLRLSKPQVNIDTGTAVAFVSEGSPVRGTLKQVVQGKEMVMTQTAASEFQGILRIAGPLETSRAERFMLRLKLVPDNPSPRAMGLSLTKKVGANDKVIFGTGDSLGIPTTTADTKFLSGARAQGVDFDAIVHPPVPLKKQ